jgi:ArsR family transcriptional regulator, arsenate/arsenite/antimonite-responsive transcriptional repressor
MKTDAAIMALAALAQETRIGIYRLLVQQGPEGLPASTIAEMLDLPNATFSFHVKELSRAGLVAARQSGRFNYYSANYPAMNELVGYLTENCCDGKECGAGAVPIKTPRRKTA